MTDVRPAAVIVLAAGQGRRMKSATPKVLHTMCGRTLLGHVLATIEPLQIKVLRSDASDHLPVFGEFRLR